MNKRILFGIILFFATAGLSVFFFTTKNKEKIHYHAGFLVYIDGKLQDFSDAKYMHIEPCNVPGVEHEEDEQKEKAHMHDATGDVVHVHRNNARWQDLFENSGITLDNNVVAYQKNIPIENFFNSPILPYQSVIIVVGNTENINLNTYITREHIEEVEGRSETCGS